MSQPPVTLNYFPVRGRGEIIRLVLYAAKRKFVDNRVEFANWPELKPKAPFGSLPFVEVGDETFGQSHAIATYFAREAGLYGSNNLDGLKIDQVMQLREDLLKEEVTVFKEKDEAKNAELTKNMNDNVYPKFLGHFERLITENQTKTGSKYTVGDKLSLADIAIFAGTESLRQKNAPLLEKYSAVKGVSELVAGLDGVKEYLKNRPESNL